MADRTCDKCGKVFPFPSHLKQHMRRKTPCSVIVEKHELPVAEQAKPHACKFCGHRFTWSSGLYGHIKNTCKIAGSEEGLTKLYEHTLRRQEAEIAAMRQSMARMEAMMERQQQQSAAVMTAPTTQVHAGMVGQVVHNQTIVQQQTNIGQVNINIFGKENLSHINGDDVKRLLDRVLPIAKTNTSEAVSMFIVSGGLMVYGDPKHPENLTCYMINKKRDEVMVHNGDRWVVQDGKSAVMMMLKTVCDVIAEHQPITVENAETYSLLLRSTFDIEKTDAPNSKEMRIVLVHNKSLIENMRTKVVCS